MKKIIGLVIVLIGSISYSQDVHFSQFYMSPLNQNPAMAGLDHDIQAILNYKDQWRNVNSPFRTFGVSYDMRAMSKSTESGFIAGGLNFVNDQAGSSKMGSTIANLSVAYHINLNKEMTLGAGVQAGIIQRGVNQQSLAWGTQYDGSAYNSSLPSGESAQLNSFTTFDMGAGLVWGYNNNDGLKMNVGFSAFHLTQPDYSFLGSDESLYMKYVAHGNATIGLGDSRWAILPGFMYYRQGPAQEIYAGALGRVILTRNDDYVENVEGAALSFGAFYRHNDAISAQLLVDYAAFTFGMSYDINISDLQVASNGRGGLELSIRFVTDIFESKPGSNSRI
ncbi:MAG: PorP/SprF family type IX secretion system membrane protein [Crocinitomicaceae bacterium]